MDRSCMMLVVYPRYSESEIVSLLREAGVEYYTAAKGLTGVGDSGPVLGSAIWPGENAAIWSAVSPDLAERVAAVLRQVRAARRGAHQGDGIALFTMPCQQLV